MQIQKGLVKYKDRSDIVCTYGLTEDGKQYYFLEGNTLANGNIVASTVLVEAIDPVVVASSIGVIDTEGNVVIPFENRSIKVITDELLLVEKANSTTPSVVEAINLRSDPLSATKLVTTAATIKENMNIKMASEGRFIFNDQFSEATICDINGNNIVDEQYYSFIGMKNNESLYFSKNTIDSGVLEYSLINRMFIAPPEPVNPDALDVNNTEVTQDLIDVAMAVEEKVTGFGAEDITAKDFEAVANENMGSVEEALPVEPTIALENNNNDNCNDAVDSTETVASEETVVEQENIGEQQDEVVETQLAALPEDKLPVEEPPVVELANEEEKQEHEEVAEVVSEQIVEAREELKDENNPDEVVEDAVTEPVEEKVDAPTTADTEQLMSFDFGDNINYSDSIDNYDVSDTSVDETVSEFKNELYDIDLDSNIFADSTIHVDSIDVSDSFGYEYKMAGAKDNIMNDVASTMTNLINLNRSQKQKISSYEERFEQAAVAHKKVVEKAKSQIRDIETLKVKIKNYETIVTKLESKITVLENKVHDQDKVIASQANELDTLRPQVEGQKELARILADAQLLLEQE